MPDSYFGECKGGPLDGKRLAHWSKHYKLFKPMIAFSPQMHADERVEAVMIGEYRLNDYGYWHWWATRKGDAYETLFG